MWLFLLFVAVPIIEIALFIQVGGAIGLWSTLLIVILTALAGTLLMRAQGAMTLNRLQNALAKGENPTDPMAQGAMILVAGILLLTPGFFTDAIGFSLLLPPVRLALIGYLSKRITSAAFVSTQSGYQHPPASEDTIDGDFAVVDDDENPRNRPPSGWTQR